MTVVVISNNAEAVFTDITFYERKKKQYYLYAGGKLKGIVPTNSIICFEYDEELMNDGKHSTDE